MGKTDDFLTRVRAAEALAEMAKDGFGASAMLFSEPDGGKTLVAALIKAVAMSAASTSRSNVSGSDISGSDGRRVAVFVFGALASLSSQPEGARLLVKAGAAQELLM